MKQIHIASNHVVLNVTSTHVDAFKLIVSEKSHETI